MEVIVRPPKRFIRYAKARLVVRIIFYLAGASFFALMLWSTWPASGLGLLLVIVLFGGAGLARWAWDK